MPEYLAPGVYVEETSFRSKSIEGVSTSTTGFVGVTLKGPTEGTPELITSFGDFERIYGGFSKLEFGGKKFENYLAHAVKNYYDNGGSRLYVARVYAAAADTKGIAESAFRGDGNDEKQKVRFVARFPGAVGNGRVVLTRADALATAKAMTKAPRGTMLKIDSVEAGSAALIGNIPPFNLPNDSTLTLTVTVGGGAGTDVAITFKGLPAEATADQLLPANIDLASDSDDRRFEVDFGTGSEIILLPSGQTPQSEIVSLINKELAGGYAELSAGNLVIGSAVKGSAAAVSVKLNPTLGFTADQDVANTEDADNNVGDLNQVSAADINKLFSDEGSGLALAGISSLNGRLLIETSDKGDDVKIKVKDTTPAVLLSILGLSTDESTGSSPKDDAVYLKVGAEWVDSSGQKLISDPGSKAAFVTVNVLTEDKEGNQTFYEDLGLAPGHPRYIGDVLSQNPSRRIDALQNMYAVDTQEVTPYRLYSVLFLGPPKLDSATFEVGASDGTPGSDGVEPPAGAYTDPLEELTRIEDISIVAAPGCSAYTESQGIQDALITHAERRKAYRFAVLDTPPGLAVSEALAVKSRLDSSYAALYHPWIVTANPLSRPDDESIPREIALPPSGFVCGIFARNDVTRGVSKSPGNEVVRGALRFETDINFAEQEVLNPRGVNCLRFFPGRGNRLWGARTTSSDPEWKYVGPRRYFIYLEHSIDRSTQWAVFENNGPQLWANVRETVSSFLYNEWVSGALLGANQDEAFFVRCDRSTMTQNDLDNGRLICLIGVAVLKPAEFVIFRIGQKTADARA